jgi:hypothetical protein
MEDSNYSCKEVDTLPIDPGLSCWTILFRYINYPLVVYIEKEEKFREGW